VEHIKELEKKLLTYLGTVPGRVAAYGFLRFFPGVVVERAKRGLFVDVGFSLSTAF